MSKVQVKHAIKADVIGTIVPAAKGKKKGGRVFEGWNPDKNTAFGAEIVDHIFEETLTRMEFFQQSVIPFCKLKGDVVSKVLAGIDYEYASLKAMGSEVEHVTGKKGAETTRIKVDASAKNRVKEARTIVMACLHKGCAENMQAATNWAMLYSIAAEGRKHTMYAPVNAPASAGTRTRAPNARGMEKVTEKIPVMLNSQLTALVALAQAELASRAQIAKQMKAQGKAKVHGRTLTAEEFNVRYGTAANQLAA